LNSVGYLEAYHWGLLNQEEDDKSEETPGEEQYGFKEVSLDSLVDGRVLSIGTLPLEIAEEVDEFIAKSLRNDNGRMRHYSRKVEKIMKQYAQNPQQHPYLPLVILYNESAAIANERIGLYFSEGNWKLPNPRD